MVAFEVQNILITFNGNDSLSQSAINRVRQALSLGLAALLKKKNRLPISKTRHYRIHVEIISNTKMSKLNQIFRGKKGPTDVLTFARWEADLPLSSGRGPSVKDLPERDLGDILIAWEVAKKQAVRFHNTYLEELERLAVHGLLHLFGYDHEAGGREEKTMFALQEAILKEVKKAPPRQSEPSGKKKAKMSAER